MNLKIGELARVTDTTAPTIRYYEQIGLLPRARRIGGQRRYDDDDVKRLVFVRRCRTFEFPIEQVRVLVNLLGNGERSCQDARDVADTHLTAVRRSVHELRDLEHKIAQLIEVSDASCCRGAAAECVMLERLAEPESL